MLGDPRGERLCGEAHLPGKPHIGQGAALVEALHGAQGYPQLLGGFLGGKQIHRGPSGSGIQWVGLWYK